MADYEAVINPWGYPLLLCSYKLHDYCKKKYPKRTVTSDMHINDDEFYYWSRTGEQRMVRNKTEIWVNDWERGFPYIKRIR